MGNGSVRDVPRGLPRARPKLGWAVVVLLVAAGVAALVRSRLRPIHVTAAVVSRGKAVEAVYATGTVEAEDRVNVKAKTAGSLAEILVKEGDAVKKGDLLARVDNPVVTFELKRGKAELSAASLQAGANAPQIAALRGQAQAIAADLDQAKLELKRLEALAQSSAVAQAELDRAAARVRQLEGQISANDAQQRATRIDLDANAARQAAQLESLASRVADTEVRSPLDGVVLSKSVEVGEVVAVNQTLFKVGNANALILEVSVDEADVARVHVAPPKGPSVTAVSLYAFPGQIFRGKVYEVLPDANRERKSFLAKVRLDAPPEGLRSGMSAEVNIITAEHDGALLIPTEALESAGSAGQADQTRGFVWLVRDERATRRAVQVGVHDLLRTEIVQGLAEGDVAVIEGRDKLTEGKRVELELRPQDKLAPMPDQTQPNQGAR